MGTPRRVGAPGARSRKVESLKKEWHELLSKCLSFFRMFFWGTTMERDKEHKIGLHYNKFSVYNEFSVAKYKEDSCANENAYDEMV
jgi:hypothetical protein